MDLNAFNLLFSSVQSALFEDTFGHPTFELIHNI